MRIQYRYKESGYIFAAWSDWDEGGIEDFGGFGGGLEIEVRIVDDFGNVVEPTPPFTPAFYEHIGTEYNNPMICWCATPPSAASWKRRDDIKPTGRS